MAIKTITGILKKDSDKTFDDFLNSFISSLNSAEADGNKYLGLLYDLKNNTISIVPSDSLKNDEGLEVQTFDFSSQNELPELTLTDIPVSGIVNSIFSGIEIQDGEILYVVGNDNKIEPKVYSGVLSDVLEKNRFNQFLIKYDGNSSVVYVRSDVDKNLISDIINSFPENYEIVNTDNYEISANIKAILQNTYENNLNIFEIKGNISTIKEVSNLFEALNNNNELVIIYDANKFMVYKDKKIPIEFFKNYKIIV